MPSNDNTIVSLQGQETIVPIEGSSAAPAATDPSLNPPTDKYAGKTIEEIKEMHRNAEKLATEKAMKLAELEKSLKSVPVEEVVITPVEIDELAKLFAPIVSQDASQSDIDMANLKKANINATLQLAFINARSKKSMPDFAEVENEVRQLLIKEPNLLLSSPDRGIQIAYDLVSKGKLETKIPALIIEAEERGKKSVNDNNAQRIQAAVVGDSGRIAPATVIVVESPEKKRSELMAQMKTLREQDPRRKQIMRELTLLTLTPAEAKGTPRLEDLVK